jgi:hypothetical protein
MKTLMTGVLFLTMGVLSSAEAKSYTYCEATPFEQGKISGGGKTVAFQIENTVLYPAVEIGGRTYSFHINMNSDYYRISVERNGRQLFFTRGWTDADAMDRLEFLFWDGSRKIIVLCGDHLKKTN